MAEALLGEMADISRVVFPPDANGAAAALAHAYAQRGTVTALVVPKRPVPHQLTPQQAQSFAVPGATCLAGDPATSAILLVSTGPLYRKFLFLGMLFFFLFILVFSLIL